MPAIQMTDPAAWWMAIALAGAVSLAAWRAGSLRGDGAIAALLVGALSLRAGWGWGIFLIGWFVLASALSRLGRARKAARTRDIVMKDDRRDAIQVLANGGVFAACALLAIVMRGGAQPAFAIALAAAAAGALAAAGADTWATEIGTLWGGQPWFLRTGRRVAAGTSGAVTISGTVAGACGALALGVLASAAGMIPARLIGAVALGGIAGATADTILGAWGQERRWCPQCNRATERRVHSCGGTTVQQGGVRGLDNDVVNVVCTLVGALVGAAIGGARYQPGMISASLDRLAHAGFTGLLRD